MEVICLEDNAFFNLIDRVVDHIKNTTASKQDKWLSTDQAMERLRIKSKTTLQKLRDEGHVRFSQPEKKWIVYDAESIDEYLEKHSKDTF
ncbi:MAG: helix-turn-helix domain-containing protein [Bacteroidetes bacterium]|nr:helix-turn-helix domain-containing protein [Bacteroidota bacterium]